MIPFPIKFPINDGAVTPTGKAFEKTTQTIIKDNLDNLRKKEIDTNLSLEYDERGYKKNIESIFEIIMDILFKIYDAEFKDPKSTVNNPSNFFKSDEMYRKRIIPVFDKLIEKEPNNLLLKKLEMFKV